jgi:hypothetical protein
MASANLKAFRRLYPKIRISWSLYKLWISNNWIGVWDYLTDAHIASTEAQDTGSEIHKRIADSGIKLVKGIEKYVVDSDTVLYEHKVILDRGQYEIVGQIDCVVPDSHLVIDWKSGKLNGYEKQLQFYMWLMGEDYTHGLLAKVLDKEGVIKLGKTMMYERSKFCDDWEMMMDTIYQSICYQIEKGQLSKYLSQSLYL